MSVKTARLRPEAEQRRKSYDEKSTVIGVALGVLLLAGGAFWIIHQSGADAGEGGPVDPPLLELPKPEITGGTRGELGIDRHINESTIDQYLNRPDAVYRDMRMLEDPADYEAIGGDRFLSGYVAGFEVVPLPYILPVYDLPEEVGSTYTGDTLFYEEAGRYVPNYAEAMSIIEELFPRDKVIFLMCGGGGYAGMTRKFLITLGWDADKIYNVGGYWYYSGAHGVQVKREENGQVTYDFDSVPYHPIDLDKLTRLEMEYDEGSVPVEALKINTDLLELAVEDTFRLEVIVLPNEAGNRSVAWTSSDERVATVHPDSGYVKATGEGEAVITAREIDEYFHQPAEGGKAVSCTVRVRPGKAPERVQPDDLGQDRDTFNAHSPGVLYEQFSQTVNNPDGTTKEAYLDEDGNVNDLWREEDRRYGERLEEAAALRKELFERLLREKKTFVIVVRSKICEDNEYVVLDDAKKILQRNGVDFLEMGSPLLDGDMTLYESSVGEAYMRLGGSVVIIRDGALYAGINPNVDVIRDEADLLRWLQKYLDVK